MGRRTGAVRGVRHIRVRRAAHHAGQGGRGGGFPEEGSAHAATVDCVSGFAAGSIVIDSESL